MKKQFIPQIGSNNTVKLFDAETGSLYRIISVEGEVLSQPICTEGELYVTVKQAGQTVIKYFSLPGGGLIRTVSTNA